ncbi:MAG TPA: cytochrome c3 family protein [Acidobacteriaceae bacterium]
MKGVCRPISLVVFAMFLVLRTALAQTPSAPPTPPRSAPAPANPAPAIPAPVNPAPVQGSAASSGPDQPIAFSHKKHAGELQMRCKFCHAPSRSGETLAIPQAATCMSCHATVATSNPEIQKLTNYAKASETIPWVRVYQVPSFVTFSHKVHVDHGNTCQECHGQVAARDQLVQESDISMGGCMNCHRIKKASTECDTCHTLQQ